MLTGFFSLWRCAFWFLIFFVVVFIYWHTFIPHFRKSTKSMFPMADTFLTPVFSVLSMATAP